MAASATFLTLAELTIKSDVPQPEVLHAEDAVHALERRIQLGSGIQIAGDKLGSGQGQCLGSRFAEVTRERPHLPPIGQKFPGNRAALLSGCAAVELARLDPGRSTEEDVRRLLGEPAGTYSGADGSRELALRRHRLAADTRRARLLPLE